MPGKYLMTIAMGLIYLCGWLQSSELAYRRRRTLSQPIGSPDEHRQHSMGKGFHIKMSISFVTNATFIFSYILTYM
jgi:hypothetical protein